MKPVLLTAEDLAALLHKSIHSIRCDIARNPSSLPPLCRIPGAKRLLWREDDVNAWLLECVEKNELIRPQLPQKKTLVKPQIKRRVGRPTNAERLARQQIAE